MLDIIGAGQAAMKLVEASRYDISSSLVMIPDKVAWETQIIGSYDLIFPHLHIDFPTRDEVFFQIFNAINDSLALHNSTNCHNGESSTPGIQTPPIVKDEFMLKEEPYGDEDSEILVRSNSPVSPIGYGV